MFEDGSWVDLVLAALKLRVVRGFLFRGCWTRLSYNCAGVLDLFCCSLMSMGFWVAGPFPWPICIYLSLSSLQGPLTGANTKYRKSDSPPYFWTYVNSADRDKRAALPLASPGADERVDLAHTGQGTFMRICSPETVVRTNCMELTRAMKDWTDFH